jgi:hypothetical protein
MFSSWFLKRMYVFGIENTETTLIVTVMYDWILIVISVDIRGNLFLKFILLSGKQS